jgi:Mrp family chromosome partitioning ATPase
VAEVDARMRRVKRKLLVLSGKGGVGKSTFSTQLAFALASSSVDVEGLCDSTCCCSYALIVS